jgi:hypothetical protein
MMKRVRQNPTPSLVTLVIALLVASVSFAFAATDVGFTTVSKLSFKDKDDKIVKEMGIRIDLAGGLNVVFTDKGDGRIGDVFVPTYSLDALPKNALGDYDLHAAVTGIGVVQAYPVGILFVLKEKHNQKAMAALMTHLQSVGAQIGVVEAGGRAFGFTNAGVAYRAVFSADANGTRVYLGH